MKNLTEQQKLEYREKKKSRIQTIRKTLSEMTEEQRTQLIEKFGIVTTIEGHPLTAHNTCFLYAQTEKPVTIIGGFQQWLKAGRIVKKGEKSLLIFVPSQKSNEGNEAAGDDDVFFFTANVFDITQTEVITE
ncbi:MAG: ArdC-like ssDNA-binding domain-containing protein [Ignavibacteria bacterium]|nr:ArdC-like ssDNA-binding domain-containing protein [Ignavibacteria bacterium]